MNDTAVEKAVEQAVTTEDKKVSGETKQETTKQETKQEETKTEGLTPEQLAEATQLYNLLANKETAPGVIDWLARQAGYTRQEIKQAETKEEKQEIKDDILESLKESLGPELQFLADKLSPAITKILEKKLGEHTADIRETIQASELEKTSAVADKVLTDLSQEYFGKKDPPPEVISRINELIDEMPPSEGLTADRYMRNLFNIAVSEKGLTKKGSSTTSKENATKNRTDASVRLASERGSSSQIPVTVPKNKMSLTDAVTAAMESVSAATKE